MGITSNVSEDHRAAFTSGPVELPYGDALRGAAIIGVALIHVATPTLQHLPNDGRGAWLLADAWFSASRWAVPVFVMLSGALLLAPRRSETTGQFYLKRASRVVIPTVFWSLFYLAWGHWMRGVPAGLSGAIRKCLAGVPYDHLYFMFVICGLYLITPAVRPWVGMATQRELCIVTLPLCVTASLGMTIAALHGDFLNAFTLWYPYVGYFLLGRLLSGLRLPTSTTLAALAVAMICAAAIFTGCYWLADHHRWRLAAALYGHFNILSMLLSMGVFVAARRMGSTGWLAGLGRLSFGVYLCHFAILDCLVLAAGRAGFSLTEQLVGLPPVTLALSAALTWIIIKVPLVRRVVGA